MGAPDDTDNQLIVPEWTFGLVTSCTTMFNSKFDALVGLAYP